MGDPRMGRYASVKIGTTLVDNIGNWKLNLAGGDIDVSKFGSSWERKMPGMQGWTAVITGMYDPADTAGQQALIDAKLAATKLTTLRLYVDSTSYWKIDLSEDSSDGCYIQSVDIDHDKAGVAQVTINVLGFGKISLT